MTSLKPFFCPLRLDLTLCLKPPLFLSLAVFQDPQPQGGQVCLSLSTAGRSQATSVICR